MPLYELLSFTDMSERKFPRSYGERIVHRLRPTGVIVQLEIGKRFLFGYEIPKGTGSEEVYQIASPVVNQIFEYPAQGVVGIRAGNLFYVLKEQKDYLGRY